MHLPTNCTNNKKQQKTKTQTSNGNKRKADTLKINTTHQAIVQASELAWQDTQFQEQDSGFESDWLANEPLSDMHSCVMSQ